VTPSIRNVFTAAVYEFATHKHQDEQETVGRSRDDEEIGRHDLADVPQERAPCL